MPDSRAPSAPSKVPGPGVVGAVVGGELEQDVAEVVVERPVRTDVAYRCLPGMAVGVDEAGHDDVVAGVDDFGSVAQLGGDVGADGDDCAAVDDDGAGTFGDRRVHRQQVSGADDESVGGGGVHGGSFGLVDGAVDGSQ